MHLPTLTARQKKVLKWIGYPVLAITVFLFTLGWTFPYDRVRDRVIDRLSDKYDVTIADVHGTFLPGGMVLEMVMLKTRPTSPDEKPVVLLFQEIEIDLSLLELLVGHQDVDISAELGGGTIEANVEMSSSGIEVTVETDDLPLTNLPGVASAIGLPVAGGLDLDIEVELPERKWKNAEGHVIMTCSGCTVGDGASTLKPRVQEGRRPSRASAFASQGVTVPKLSLGDLRAELQLRKGIGTFKSFAAKSGDGWLKFDGKLELRDPIGQSRLPGCMSFFLSDDLRKREPNFANITIGMGKHQQADGSYALPTNGKLSPFAFDAKKQCGTPAAGDDAVAGGDARPSLGAAADRPRRGEPPTPAAPGSVVPNGIPTPINPRGALEVAAQPGEAPPPSPSQPTDDAVRAVPESAEPPPPPEVQPPPEAPPPAQPLEEPPAAAEAELPAQPEPHAPLPEPGEAPPQVE